MRKKNWFSHPTASERIHPFWFWNGDMVDEEIIRQIGEMVTQGVGGFFICPRQGLKIPYLSDAWFQKVKFAVQEAERQGLDVWLYDEYPYPSGVAGGEVLLAHPDAKHYSLYHQVFPVENGNLCANELPWARLLSAKAVPLDPATGIRLWDQAVDIANCIGNTQSEPLVQKSGLTDYNRKRFFTYNTIKKIHWAAPSGRWEVHVYMEKELKNFKYFGTYIDPCHKEAVQTFIRLTHERYARELGSFFGGTIKGIFADETGFLEINPWSPRLLPYFNENHGYDIREHLHAILYGEGENAAKVRHAYFQALHVMLGDSFHLPIRKWCDQHGLHYVAEVPALRMSTQRHSTIIGGDSAHEKLGRPLQWILDFYTKKFRNNPKMVSSLSRQLGCSRALIECFHSVGWSMTLQDARWMIDRMAALGINFFNFHAFFYTLDGLTKHDAPPSQFLQAPYWKYFRLLGDYTARISAVMSRGAADNGIAVLDPTTTLWTHMGNPLRRGFIYCGKGNEGEVKLERFKAQWTNICQSLLFHRFDYDHLDPEILSEATIVQGEIRIGIATYSILILPPLSNLEFKAWEKIKLFIEQGGTVIAQGSLPYEDIQEEHGICEEIQKMFNPEARLPNILMLSDEEELIPVLKKLKPQAVTLSAGGSHAFLMQRRIMPDQSMVVFVTNQEGGEHQTRLVLDVEQLSNKLSVKDSRLIQVAKLNLETGTRETLKLDRDDEVCVLPLAFAAYESHLIEIAFATPADPVAVSPPWEWLVQAQVPWKVTADRPNILRFDHFDLLANGISGKGIEAATFIEQCAQMGRSPAVQFSPRGFGVPMVMRNHYPVRSQYSTRFAVDQLPGSCFLWMDRGAISGDFVIEVNGKRLAVADFHRREVYDHLNQACEITEWLHLGENSLSIQVEVQHDWDGVVDALYLMGDFGVELRPSVSGTRKEASLVSPLQESPLQSGPVAGYPYFAGTLTYARTIGLADTPTLDTFEFVFPDWDEHLHDCLEVCVNGHSLGVRAWTPYRWLGSSAWLKKGENRVEVKVTNSLAGMLEGQYFDYASHQLKEVGNS